MTEISTLVTDYLLGALALWLAARLLRDPAVRLPTRLWGWAFVAFALAAFAGGTYHGFRLLLDPTTLFWLWKAVIYAIGVFGLATVSGCVVAAATGRPRVILLGGMMVVTAVYGVFMATHDAFIYVVWFNGAAMTSLLGIQAWTAWRWRDPASPWIIAGIAVSAVGAAVQVSGVRLHAHFNHNDLFHVIQMLGIYLLFRGARRLPSRRPHLTAPT